MFLDEIMERGDIGFRINYDDWMVRIRWKFEVGMMDMDWYMNIIVFVVWIMDFVRLVERFGVGVIVLFLFKGE